MCIKYFSHHLKYFMDTDRLTRDREADIEHFANFVTQPVIQKPLGKYLEALKAKSKKK